MTKSNDESEFEARIKAKWPNAIITPTPRQQSPQDTGLRWTVTMNVRRVFQLAACYETMRKERRTGYLATQGEIGATIFSREYKRAVSGGLVPKVIQFDVSEEEMRKFLVVCGSLFDSCYRKHFDYMDMMTWSRRATSAWMRATEAGVGGTLDLTFGDLT